MRIPRFAKPAWSDFSSRCKNFGVRTNARDACRAKGCCRIFLKFADRSRLGQIRNNANPLALYQRHQIVTDAHGRVAIERMRPGSAVSAFQASQQASTISV